MADECRKEASVAQSLPTSLGFPFRLCILCNEGLGPACVDLEIDSKVAVLYTSGDKRPRGNSSKIPINNAISTVLVDSQEEG